MKTSRIPRKWRWLKPNIFPTVNKKDLGRDYYSDNGGRKRIFQTIQPIHDVGALIPFDLNPIKTKTVAAGFARIEVEPTNIDEVWEIYFITAIHDDVAAKPVSIRYSTPTSSRIQNLTSSAGHNIGPTVVTPIFPILYDLTGAADHEHTVSLWPLTVEKNKRVIDVLLGPATNGKVFTVQYMYKKVI